jgi:DNA-binding beta-propeller fold protein YncE
MSGISAVARRQTFSLIVGCWLSLLACANEPAEIEDYQGPPAYPSQRTTFPRDGRRLGYIANRFSDTISVVDLDSMTLLGTAPVGRDPVDIDGPFSLTVDPVRRLAYAALGYPQSVVSAHEAEAGAVPRSGFVQMLSLDDLSPLGELRVDPSASELALSPDGTELLVTHSDRARASQVTAPIEERRANLGLIAESFRISEGAASVRKLPLCVVPASVVFGKDGTRAFVACTGEDSLVVVDTVNLAVLSRVKAGVLVANKPYALVSDTAGQRLLLSNQVARSVVVFTATDEPIQLAIATVTGVPLFPLFVSDAEFVVPTQDPNALIRVDAATGAIAEETLYSSADCLNPSHARMTVDQRLFLVCEGDHFHPGALVELDPSSHEITGRVTLGLYPERLTILEPGALEGSR